MIRNALLLSIAAFAPIAGPTKSAPAPTAQPLHCQVPCGIYGDQMRIHMLMEDAATIEKGMMQIVRMEAAEEKINSNQMVRWVMTKDQHAQSIQETVASYWLAQRIKSPKEGDENATKKYHRQLSLLHGITVAAMKCKQTTEKENVDMLRELALEFSSTYFTREDLEHIKKAHTTDHR